MLRINQVQQQAAKKVSSRQNSKLKHRLSLSASNDKNAKEGLFRLDVSHSVCTTGAGWFRSFCQSVGLSRTGYRLRRLASGEGIVLLGVRLSRCYTVTLYTGRAKKVIP